MKEEPKKEEKKSAGELQGKLTKCEKEKEEYLDGWKRAKADFVNYKNEEAQRFENFYRMNQEVIMRELIAVLDSFELGISSSGGEAIEKKGVELIRNQLENALKKHGVEKIKVSLGDKFDPSKHEAVAEIESEKPAGTIIEEIEQGYMFLGKILRPARVKVAK